MGDKKPGFAGNRIIIVDPNEEVNQSTSIFADKYANMSVPLEDLSIMVEFVTEKKGRSIITLDKKNSSSIVSDDKNKIKVNFIDSTSNKSTNGENYLTTQYTNASTQLDYIEETLGITNIEIEFNSSYAPMININFVDIKGASIFQNGGTSKYNVFFRLPYPLFELTIKGYYGKPVKYCLHMTKCNTKFNSQTGNFEIAAQFVGYTYALLSDMLLGYIGAAGITKAGEAKLDAMGVKPITFFMKEVSDINAITKNEVLVSKNQNVIDYNNTKKGLKNIEEIESLIDTIIKTLNDETSLVIKSNNNSVVISKDISTTDAISQIPNEILNKLRPFIEQINAKVKEYNQNITLTELLLPETTNSSSGWDIYLIPIIMQIYYCGFKLKPSEYKTIIKNRYSKNPLTNSTQDEIYSRIEDALSLSYSGRDCVDGSPTYSTEKAIIYDFTEAINYIKQLKIKLKEVENQSIINLGLDLKEKVSAKLGYSPTIRNIFNVFTSHVEVFLSLLYDVSKKYNDPKRIAELKSIVESDNTDISINSAEIFPWPEYHEKDINGSDKEKYIGSSSKIKNPRNIPEVVFVEEMYTAMIEYRKKQSEAQLITEEGVVIWNALNPIDSAYASYENVQPYDRLPESANFNDVARLLVLRAVGFLKFSNNLLSVDEIKNFVEKEVNSILTKYDIEGNKIIDMLATNYDVIDKYINATGSVGIGNKITPILKFLPAGTEENNITLGTNKYKYQYLYNDSTNRYILPVTPPYENTSSIKYDITKESINNEPKYFLTNRSIDEVDYLYLTNNSSRFLDKGSYIGFIDSIDYKGGNQQSPAFNFNNLSKEIGNNPDELVSAGFNANSGSYGVQEFKLINYNGTYGVTTPIDYSTIFYSETILSDGENNYMLPFSSTERGEKSNLSVIQVPIGTYIPEIDDKPRFSSPSYEPRLPLQVNPKYYKINYGKRNNLGKDILSLSRPNSSISCPYLNFNIEKNAISLFGSRLYNGQKTDEAKAFLFLHCFPWNGLVKTCCPEVNGIFNVNEIINTFKYRTGFVQVPKLFPAFIGGILKRYTLGNENTDIITFTGINDDDYLIFDFDAKNHPKTTQYLKHKKFMGAMSFGKGNDEYLSIENILTELPDEVKKAFIKEFDNFVNGEFIDIKSLFEIIPTVNGTTSEEKWRVAFDNIDRSTSANTDNSLYLEVKLSNLINNLDGNDKAKISNTYDSFIFVASQKMENGELDKNIFKYNYFLEYKDTSPQNQKLKELFYAKKYISNQSWFIWSRDNVNKENIPYLNEDNVRLYFGEVIEKIKNFVGEKQKSKLNVTDIDAIKLEIYRNLKKIYDKWVAYSDDDKSIMFQCCTTNHGIEPTRLSGDTRMHEYRKANGNKPTLIDSFRFVTRSFKDIGDDFNINPMMVNKLLYESTNISFYDFISRILTDNNFDFIALPSFVDYNDPKEVANIFKPYPYYEAANISVSGPSFVCVYVGQTSTKLDFTNGGNSAEYPNDGFDLEEGCIDCPEDFKSDKQAHEDYGAAFIVRYGHQNQNIFKDIVLDQSEFSETAESLEITDNIANNLYPANQLYVGQNLYSVYSARSYKVEVEMLGDAMIQPMMYFQLANIPMFHGAYLITKVKHSLKPNHMSTVFSGVRIKKIETPLVSVGAIYAALLNGSDIPETNTNGVSTNATNNGVVTNASGSFAPIVVTIKNNLGSNGNPEGKGVGGTGKIILSEIELPTGIIYSPVFNEDKRMINEAVLPLKQMLTDWVAWMKANNFAGNKQGNTTYYAYINSVFRTKEKQDTLAKQLNNGKNKLAATPGTSLHGWGIAFDLQFFRKNGTIIKNINKVEVNGTVTNVSNIKEGFNFNINESLRWLIENSYRYGFIIPISLRDENRTEEFWHFEYHGTAAQCLLRKNPTFYNTGGPSITVSTDKPMLPIVINPKEPDGKIAVYTDCTYKYIKSADGTPTTSISTNDETRKNNQLVVKNYLKDYFTNTLRLDNELAKVMAAGVMGNIHKETLPAFNEKNWTVDVGNGVMGGGLIAWNSAAYPDAITVIKGKSALEQIKKVFGPDNYTLFVNDFIRDCKAASNLTPWYAAYFFAKDVERCSNCRSGEAIYRNPNSKYHPVDRSIFAQEYYEDFNDPNNFLYW